MNVSTLLSAFPLHSKPKNDSLSMATTSATQIANLDGDAVLSNSSGPVFLDNGRNAIVTAADGNLASLHINNTGATSSERLGIHTGTGSPVQLPGGMVAGGRIVVQGTEISTISRVGSSFLDINFNDAATSALVQDLVRALTYTNTTPTGGFSSEGSITIQLFPKSGAYAQVQVDIIDSITGSAGNDTFSSTQRTLSNGNIIDGGGGNDTLQLAGGGIFGIDKVKTFTSIETVQGSAADDVIRIKASQLTDVKTINGGGYAYEDRLDIQGTTIDLTGKTITGFSSITLVDDNATITLNSKDAALLVNGMSTNNDTLILTSGILSESERQTLHSRGVDTIVNNGTTTSGNAPVITNLDGDHVDFVPGRAVFLDAGRNMTLSSEGSLSYLYVASNEGYDRIGIDTSGTVSVSNDKVSVGGVEIGTIQSFVISELRVAFNSNATVARVQELVRALTYKYDGSSAAQHEVQLTLRDTGNRATSAKIQVNPVTSLPGDNPIDAINIVRGTKAKNVLKGGSGRDKIYGDYGNDVLTGGAGEDIFVFNSKLGTAKTNKKVNFDRLTDFSVKDDTIWLDNKIFKKLGKGTEKKPGKLPKKFLKIGPKAKDKDDYLIYNKKKGVLSYDVDGSGAKAAVEFAQLTKKPNLTHADIFVV